jgi:thiol:disulfide interchange protein DsbD
MSRWAVPRANPAVRSTKGSLVSRRLLWYCLAVGTAVSAWSQVPAFSEPTRAQSTVATPGPLDSLRNFLGGSKAPAELLSPDDAYKIVVTARDSNTLIATLTPTPDYYLYRDRISFEVLSPAGISVASVALPEGKSKADPNFGTVQVYYHPVEAVIALRYDGVAPPEIQLLARYQGCNDPLGVCYPPIEKTVTVALSGFGTASAATSPIASTARRGATSVTAAAAQSAAQVPSDPDVVGLLFAQGNHWVLVAAFFGFGLLLAFTPCMLPMIPILSGIILGRGVPLTTRHAFGLSAIYVLGMAITYALAGVAAGFAGILLSAYLQNPWVLGSFALMFGLYELQLPATLQNHLTAASGRMRGGRALGVFLMGVLSAIIVGPCVAAPLAGALLYIGQTHDVLLGGAALFSMAIGMGIPLLVIGASAGSLLPKSGPWTVAVQRVFGVVMLGVALYMLTPVIPVVAQQLLWASLLIVPAIYLHALDPLPVDAPGHRRLFKGVGVLSLLVGAALLVGALSGQRELLQPLAGLQGAAATRQTRELPFQPVRSVADLDARLLGARGQPVMLDFWAEWCVSCKEMEQFTFSDERVHARLKNTLLLRADVTANNADDQALLRRFKLFGPPGIVFFDRKGTELALRVIGYQSADRFLASLARVESLDLVP